MFRKFMIAAIVAVTPILAIAQDPVTERPKGDAPKVAAKPQAAPAAKPQAAMLPGSMWGGTEEYNNNGKLAFALKKDGGAVMLDANGIVDGTWCSKANRVTITFDNCVYEGTVQNGVITGRARFTRGDQAGVNWAFRVAYDDPFRGREYRGRENLNGFGAVRFVFGANGTVEMIDARSRVRGTYTLDLNQITLRFGNCVYVGTLQNNRVAGVARYTSGEQTQPWTFNVSLAQR